MPKPKPRRPKPLPAPFDPERNARAFELDQEIDRRWATGELTREGFLGLAKELATLRGDGFGHSCTLFGMGQALEAVDDLFAWARAQGIQPLTMIGP